MAHKFDRMVEIRSALMHLHSVVTRDAVGRTGEKAAEAIDNLGRDLGQVYGEDFSDLEIGDSYGEIEYLRWASAGMQDLLGFSSEEEMEKALDEGE